MPDIDPAALSRPSGGIAAFTASSTSNALALSAKSLAAAGLASGTLKGPKGPSSGQRIDLEPLYAALKRCVGDHWVTYKEAISLFVLGHLNQQELAARIDSFIQIDPTTEHRHNQLLSAIYGNVTRDLPDNGVATWVSANDKPATVVKPLSGDAAEQRLKTEVMQLPPRDRRRIKDIDVKALEPQLNGLTEYHQALQIKAPEILPGTAGGLGKSNWEIEIHKRYSQPLAEETGEFPDGDSVHSRMVPICYEEGITGAANEETATFMAFATETYIKEVLSEVLGRTRSNGRGFIMTSAFKRQYEREGELWLQGDLQKDSSSMLPVEQQASNHRQPLSETDIRLSLQLGDMYLGRSPLVASRIASSYLNNDLNEPGSELSPPLIDKVNGENISDAGDGDVQMNGFGDDSSVDDLEFGWEGIGTGQQDGLGSLLDDCLAVGQ